jgi:hypothetical protein
MADELKDLGFEEEMSFEDMGFEEERQVPDGSSDPESALMAAGVGLGTKAVLETTDAEKKLDELSSLLAARSAQVPFTSQGKEIVQQEIQAIPLKPFMTMEDVGKRLREEDLVKVFPFKDKDIAKIRESSKEDRKQLDRLLKSVDVPMNQEEVLAEYERLLGESADPRTRKGRQALRALKADAPQFEGEAMMTDIEALKRKEDYVKDPDKTGTKMAQEAKQRALRTSVEKRVKDIGGQELLDEFKALKKRAGESKVIDKAVSEVLEKARTRREVPTNLLSEVANRIIGGTAAVGSKAAGALAKTTKALPFVGAGATFASARAEGADVPEAIAETAVEEATDLLGPVKMALDPEPIGPAAADTSPGAKLERGEDLSSDEIQKLQEQMRDYDQSNFESFQRRAQEGLAPEYNRMMDMSPVESAEIVQRIYASGNPEYEKFVDRYIEAASENDVQQRSAKMFELYQRPDFRKMMRDLEAK